MLGARAGEGGTRRRDVVFGTGARRGAAEVGVVVGGIGMVSWASAIETAMQVVEVSADRGIWKRGLPLPSGEGEFTVDIVLEEGGRKSGMRKFEVPHERFCRSFSFLID